MDLILRPRKRTPDGISYSTSIQPGEGIKWGPAYCRPRPRPFRLKRTSAGSSTLQRHARARGVVVHNTTGKFIFDICPLVWTCLHWRIGFRVLHVMNGGGRRLRILLREVYHIRFWFFLSLFPVPSVAAEQACQDTVLIFYFPSSHSLLEIFVFPSITTPFTFYFVVSRDTRSEAERSIEEAAVLEWRSFSLSTTYLPTYAHADGAGEARARSVSKHRRYSTNERARKDDWNLLCVDSLPYPLW